LNDFGLVVHKKNVTLFKYSMIILTFYLIYTQKDVERICEYIVVYLQILQRNFLL